MRFLFVAVVVVAAQASTIPPSQPDVTTAGPPDVTDVDTTAAVTGVTDTDVPVTDTAAPVTDTMAPDTDVTSATPAGTDVTTDVPMNATLIPEDCNPSMEQIQPMIDYSNAPEFQDLSESERILVFELLAAAEACRIKDFINAETAQRIFLFTEGGYTPIYSSAAE